MGSFDTGQTVLRRDVHRSGRVWSEQALRGLADTTEALMAACSPAAEARWAAVYANARAAADRTPPPWPEIAYRPKGAPAGTGTA